MASVPKSLNDLPDEILLQILSHLGPEDLCLNIAKVCKHWNGLAKDVKLWKKPSYKCDTSSDINRIEEVLTNAPALHSLIISDRTDAAHILSCLFRRNYDLRKLILKKCSLGEDNTGLLSSIVTLNPHLESLSLECCVPISSEDFCLIQRLNQLSELRISDCEELSGKTFRLIADSCQHLKKLSLLREDQIEEGDVIHVIKKLGKQLTALSLDGDPLTDVAYSYLNNCARLQELEIFDCAGMSDRGLLEGIASLHKLTFLRLCWGSNLTAKALSTFFNQPSMTSIVSLDLSFCSNLDDEGLKGIAKRCVHLKDLAVCWCRNVTDSGISMVISRCKQLRVLNLTELPSITGNGWMALVPSHLPHLRVLCLALCCKVCDTYVKELKAAVPELKIIK